MVNKNMELQKEYYSVAELAALLRVSRITVFNRIKQGRIAAKKFGKAYHISANDVRDLVHQDFSEKMKGVVADGVRRVVSEYAETLRLLGKE